MIDSQDCKAMYVYIMYSLVLQNQLYHIMFCEDQTYADFASVDRFIKSHITILAIRQKLDPQSFRFYADLARSQGAKYPYSSGFEYYTSQKRQIWL